MSDCQNTVRFSVLRCRTANAPDGTPRIYGPAHGSVTGDATLCGLQTDENWYIATNDRRGLITCDKCLRKIK
jgi:hypothetical protein